MKTILTAIILSFTIAEHTITIQRDDNNRITLKVQADRKRPQPNE